MNTTTGYTKGRPKKTSQGANKSRIKTSSMNKSKQGSDEVQISEYRQIVQELSQKLQNYERLYGTVFKK